MAWVSRLGSGLPGVFSGTTWLGQYMREVQFSSGLGVSCGWPASVGLVVGDFRLSWVCCFPDYLFEFSRVLNFGNAQIEVPTFRKYQLHVAFGIGFTSR